MILKLYQYLVACGLASILLIPGASSARVVAPEGDTPAIGQGQSGQSCRTIAECAGGMACLGNNTCGPCTRDDQCLGEGTLCVEGRCANPEQQGVRRETPACTSNTDCGGLICRNGSCATCTQDRDCGPAAICEEDTGRCTASFTSVTPKLQIPIPGVQFSDLQVKTGEGGTQYLDIPFLAQYIIGVYRFAVIIVGTLATVMLIWGGIQWMLSGAMETASKAKETVRNSLTGLLLVLGSYVLLYTINPELVKFRSIPIEIIRGETLTYVPPDAYRRITGRYAPPPAEIKAMAEQVAQTEGLEACALLAIVGAESGYRADALGHDENVAQRGVGSRRTFITLGTLFSGGRIPGLMGNLMADILNPRLKNDDKEFNPGQQGTYGLDGRFTHGIGLGQFTILLGANGRMQQCPDGNIGREIGERCYNAAELFDPQIALQVGARLFKTLLASNGNSVPMAFRRYAGNGCFSRYAQCVKMKSYAQCSNTGVAEIEHCSDWIGGTPPRPCSPGTPDG